MLIDTHCHLAASDFTEDVQRVIERALAGGVARMLCIADDDKSSKKSVELAEKYEQIFCTIGVHPHNANKWSEVSFKQLQELYETSAKIKAIGEIGLDYHYNFSTPEEQKTAFIEQIEWAKALDVPIVLHNRESFNDVWAIMQKLQPKKAVLHCCTEPWANVESWLSADYLVSFTGIATFPKATDVHEVIARCPLNQMMLETDSPYLAPIPHRGKRNEPANVHLVAERVAELKNIPIEEVIAVTGKAAVDFFGL